jgi:hypothetical protein
MIAAIFGDLIPYIVAALVAVAGFWGYGKVKKREGAVERDAKRDAADAKETIKALEGRNAVEDDVARTGNARDRLRSDWKE